MRIPGSAIQLDHLPGGPVAVLHGGHRAVPVRGGMDHAGPQHQGVSEWPVVRISSCL